MKKDMYALLNEDKELMEFYQTDVDLKNLIDFGYIQNIDMCEILLVILKDTYKTKKAIEDEYAEYIKYDCRPIQQLTGGYDFSKFPTEEERRNHTHTINFGMEHSMCYQRPIENRLLEFLLCKTGITQEDLMKEYKLNKELSKTI